jgi:hypothetical protein
LEQDYDGMQTMFLAKPPTFSQVLWVLGEAEREINDI